MTNDRIKAQTPSTTTFAQRVRTARKIKGWSQAQLSREVGCSQGIVNQIELGNVVEVKQLLLFRLADTLDVNARWLALGTGTPVKWVNLTPDEKHLLELFNGLSEPFRDAVVHMAASLPQTSSIPSHADPFAGVDKPPRPHTPANHSRKTGK